MIRYGKPPIRIVLPIGVDVLEDEVRRLESKHDDRCPGLSFLRREGSTALNDQISYHEEIRRRARELDSTDRPAVVSDGGAAVNALDGHPVRNRELLPNRVRVLEPQSRASVSSATLFAARVDAHPLPAAERDRVHAEDLSGEVLTDVSVEALHHRHHDDQEEHAEYHAQGAE